MTATITTTSTGAKVRTTTIKPTAPATIKPTAPATAPTGMDAITALVAAATAPAVPTAPTVDPLASARAEFANALGEANKSSDRWTQNYAAALNEHLPIEWWVFDHRDESTDGKTVRREQKATYSALKNAGYSNPSVAWKRVRNAAAILKGWIDAETEEEEETEEETEASKAASKYAKVQALIADAVKKLGKMDADHGPEMQGLADIAKRLPSL